MESINSQVDKIDYGDRQVRSMAYGLAAVGAFKFAKWAYGAFKGFVKYMVLPRHDLRARYGGGWAFVTGASDGIGRAYALELARSGFNIILMARNEEKLQGVAKEIRDTYKVATKLCVFDFGTLGPEETIKAMHAKIEDAIVDKDISVLVNNVGFGGGGMPLILPLFDYMNTISVNISAQTQVSAVLIPKLLARCKDGKKSGCINVSSIAVYHRAPQMTLYGASKAFNFNFSNSMREAYKDNIDFLTVTPGGTISRMYPIHTFWSVSAEGHARQTINQLGRQDITYGHVWHSLENGIGWFPPLFVLTTLHTIYLFLGVKANREKVDAYYREELKKAGKEDQFIDLMKKNFG